MLHKGELMCLTSIGRDEPYLRFAFALLFLLLFILVGRLTLTLRDKGQPASIRRPAWAMRIGLASSEAFCFATASRYHPARRAILVFAVIDGCDDKGHMLAVRCNARLAYGPEPVQNFHRYISYPS